MSKNNETATETTNTDEFQTEVLDTFNFGTRAGRYPWNEWMDGQIRKITVHKPQSVRQAIYNRANGKNATHDVQVSVKVTDADKEMGEVTFQFTPKPAVEAPAEG